MGKGGYNGGSTVIHPGSGWFSKSRPESKKGKRDAVKRQAEDNQILGRIAQAKAELARARRAASAANEVAVKTASEAELAMRLLAKREAELAALLAQTRPNPDQDQSRKARQSPRPAGSTPRSSGPNPYSTLNLPTARNEAQARAQYRVKQLFSGGKTRPSDGGDEG
jgi:hypothetical protein